MSLTRDQKRKRRKREKLKRWGLRPLKEPLSLAEWTQYAGNLADREVKRRDSQFAQTAPLPSARQPADEWQRLRETINGVASAAGEWAGAPMPIDGIPLVMEKRYPFPGLNGQCFGKIVGKEDERTESDPIVINSWYCDKHNARVYIVQDSDGKRRHVMVPEFGGSRLDLAVRTLGAVMAWGDDTEGHALEKLRSMITAHAFKCYTFTGGFLETSKRSGVTYFFRRLRPTIALKEQPGIGMKTMAVLCLHPLGYYEGTFAGVMCPTDDVIAHLTLMRGAEPLFWRKANNHPSWKASSGL